jgi:hypothetical protein
MQPRVKAVHVRMGLVVRICWVTIVVYVCPGGQEKIAKLVSIWNVIFCMIKDEDQSLKMNNVNGLLFWSHDKEILMI